MSTRVTAPPPERRRSRGPGVFTVIVLLGLGVGGAWAAGWIDLSRFGIQRPLTDTTAAPAPVRAAPTSTVLDSAPTVEAYVPPPVVSAPAPRAQPDPAKVPPDPVEQADRGGPPPAPVPSPAWAAIDQAADSIDLAVRMYQDVERRGGDCAALGRVRNLLDAAVGRYNIAKNASTRALDDLRTARDRALYAGADAVDARFRRAGCRAS